MNYSIINIRNLELFNPKLESANSYKKGHLDSIDIENYFHFPIICKPDGEIWRHGSLYLLSKLEAFKKPDPSWLLSQCGDLLAFIKCMQRLELNYLEMPKRKAARPTYQYRFHLQDLIENRAIAQKTAQRRINTVINFYRWLVENANIEFSNAPWVERTTAIYFETQLGFKKTKIVKSTNLAVNVSQRNDTFSDKIFDGGKLKPLSNNEQLAVFRALGKLANTEMTLIFLLAVSTGARMQTICTLRIGDLETDKVKEGKETAIVVGPGTLVDTKFNRRAVLYIPSLLMSQLSTYSKSPRANSRRERNRSCKSLDQQYVFLTKSGAPFYMSKSDPSIGSVKRIPSGNAITQFIRSRLVPELNKMGHEFEFRFHDLRATYGMNLVEINHEKLSKGEISYEKLRGFIQERMWHKSGDITDRYLNHKANHKFLLNAQSSYEESLLTLLNQAFNSE